MKRLVAAFFVIALLSVPASALADSTQSGYTKNQSQVQNNGASRTHCTHSGSGSGSSSSGGSGSGSSGSRCSSATSPGGASGGTPSSVSPAGAVKAASATRSTSASTLPFTGIDVALLAAGGAALLGAGLLVRRFSIDS